MIKDGEILRSDTCAGFLAHYRAQLGDASLSLEDILVRVERRSYDGKDFLYKILAKEEIYNPIINKSHCDIIQGKRKKNQYGQQYKIFYKKTVKHFSLSNPADRHSFPERYDILSGKFLENYFFM